MAKTAAEIICDGYSGKLKDEYIELAENILFLEKKLQETREKAKDVDLVIPYDNGGGQTGIRENPIFNAYTKLLTQYDKALQLLVSLLEDKQQPKQSKAKLTMLSNNVKKLREQA